MITRIEIDNFQVHRRVRFDLDRVTVFVGPNDTGKSALLRALRWLSINQPAGEAFRAWNSPETAVAAKTDGRWVERVRSDNTNKFILDGKNLPAAGRGGIPQDVAELLNIGEDNFQSQLDLPFWFVETGPELSRKLNRIVNLDLIDVALGEAANLTRDRAAAVKAAEVQLEEALARRKALSWVPEFADRVDELDRLEDQAHWAAVQAEDLEDLVTAARKAEADLVRLDRAGQDGMAVVALGLEWVMATSNEWNLQQVVGEGRRVAALAGPPIDLGPLLKLRAKADEAAEHERDLGGLIVEARELEESLCRLDEAARVREGELREASWGRCPLCNQPVDDPSQFSRPTGTPGPKPPPPGARTQNWGGLEE
jgi:hypothetical protein